MVVKEQRQGAVTVLSPDGPIAGDDVVAFKQAVTEAARKTMGRLVVDLAATPFVDSEGLEAMLEISDALSTSGQTLRLCGICDTVRTILQITGLAEQFDEFADANSAVRSFL